MVFGALGVGIGFGLQELTRNLTSVLTLLMEGKLKVGDQIEFGDTTGFIREISIRFTVIRSTVIRTCQGAEIVVPYSAITNAPAKNLSYQSPNGRVDVQVTVAHGCDLLALTDPPPNVLLHGLQSQGMVFELWAWTLAIHADLSLRNSLNYAIEQGLRERHIELAGARQQIQLLSSRCGSAQEDEERNWRPLRAALPDHPCFRHMDERRLRELGAVARAAR